MTKLCKQDRVFKLINTALLLFTLFIVLYPCYFVLIASFSDPMEVNIGNVLLLPKGTNLEAYRMVFRDADVWTGYTNTVIYTALGTSINVVLTVCAAFPLSRRKWYGKKFFMMILVFTLFFNGGLIPTYLLINSLDMIDTLWVMILPEAIAVWNVVIVRTYIQKSIPYELEEAAYLDGCSKIRLLVSIILPLSKAVLAVIALYYAVGHWNSYMRALIYIRSKSRYPLQLVLRSILIQNQISEDMMAEVESSVARLYLAEQIKYALIIVSTLPMIIIYPFVQKYFVKGVMLGSLKG